MATAARSFWLKDNSARTHRHTHTNIVSRLLVSMETESITGMLEIKIGARSGQTAQAGARKKNNETSYM